MAILTQFILRLSFGLALGMALTNPRQVTSGYYRNHLYVLLGLNVLATMAALAEPDRFALVPPILAAIFSYAGSVIWLYEKPRAGIALLTLVAAASLWGAWVDTDWQHAGGTAGDVLTALDSPSSGLVLGLTMAAMFLGHWYLNSPTMAVGPLKRLIALMAAAICLRAVVEGASVALFVADAPRPTTDQWLFLALRWLSGIVGALGVTVMAWQTLKIPNTQAATGLLYVGVIATFLGELTSLLLTAHSAYPL